MKIHSILTTAAVAFGLSLTPALADDHGHDHDHDHEHVMVKKNVVEVAAGEKDFTTLVTAVKAAGLAEALSGDGPFTIFAPTNAAFEKVDKAMLAELLKPENKEKLASILKYHVVSGKVLAKDVKAGPVPTLNGQTFDVAVKDGAVMVDNAKVVKTDIMGTNGVIHVIDSVILPEMK